jgi:hypothetical protein
MIAIFDLDGTLALNEHRQHFLEERPQNWKAFEEACVNDVLNRPIAVICRELSSLDHTIYIFSGRSDTVELQTRDWLDKNDVPYDGVHLRRSGDFRDDRIVKREMFDKFFMGKNYKNCDFIVFDDRQKVVDMWREMGLTCCQVAPGNF